MKLHHTWPPGKILLGTPEKIHDCPPWKNPSDAHEYVYLFSKQVVCTRTFFSTECTTFSPHIPTVSEVYDPCFLLPAFSDMLAPENLVDCRSFIQQGALSFLLLCLASHCPAVRHCSAECLSLFYEHAEGALGCSLCA